MRTLLFLTLLISANQLGYSQKNVDGYLAGSIQFARNKKNFAGDAHQWKSSYYNSIKIGPKFNDTFIIGVEYSSILYRWTDRTYILDFLLDSDDDDQDGVQWKATVGEKINNYKLFTQVFPFKENGFFVGAAWGYSQYRNFRLPGTQRHGTAFSLHVGLEVKHIGFVMSYYNGRLKRNEEHYNFSSYNIGITFSTGRFKDDHKKTKIISDEF